MEYNIENIHESTQGNNPSINVHVQIIMVKEVQSAPGSHRLKRELGVRLTHEKKYFYLCWDVKTLCGW